MSTSPLSIVPDEDPVPADVRAVIELFGSQLAKIAFPDVDAASLRREVDELRAEAKQVARARRRSRPRSPRARSAASSSRERRARGRVRADLQRGAPRAPAARDRAGRPHQPTDARRRAEASRSAATHGHESRRSVRRDDAAAGAGARRSGSGSERGAERGGVAVEETDPQRDLVAAAPRPPQSGTARRRAGEGAASLPRARTAGLRRRKCDELPVAPCRS